MGNWGYNPTCGSCSLVLTARGPPRVLLHRLHPTPTMISHTLGKLKPPSNCFCPKGAEWRSGTTPEATGNGDLGKQLNAFIFVISQLIYHHKESTKFRQIYVPFVPWMVWIWQWVKPIDPQNAFVWYHNFDPWPSFFVQCVCVCACCNLFSVFWTCSSESTLRYECRTHDMLQITEPQLQLWLAMKLAFSKLKQHMYIYHIYIYILGPAQTMWQWEKISSLS